MVLTFYTSSSMIIAPKENYSRLFFFSLLYFQESKRLQSLPYIWSIVYHLLYFAGCSRNYHTMFEMQKKMLKQLQDYCCRVYRPIRFQERYIASSAIPGGRQHDTR